MDVITEVANYCPEGRKIKRRKIQIKVNPNPLPQTQKPNITSTGTLKPNPLPQPTPPPTPNITSTGTWIPITSPCPFIPSTGPSIIFYRKPSDEEAKKTNEDMKKSRANIRNIFISLGKTNNKKTEKRACSMCSDYEDCYICEGCRIAICEVHVRAHTHICKCGALVCDRCFTSCDEYGCDETSCKSCTNPESEDFEECEKCYDVYCKNHGCGCLLK